MTREESQKKVSSRLCELMELKGIKQVDLIGYVNKSLGRDTLKSSTMSDYAKGKRPITREHMELFSECIGTDIGYLLATDSCICKSYFDYLNYSKAKIDEELKKFFLDVTRHDTFYRLFCYCPQIGQRTFSSPENVTGRGASAKGVLLLFDRGHIKRGTDRKCRAEKVTHGGRTAISDGR